jgi:hypothetical protein
MGVEVNLKRVLGIIAVILVIYFIVTSPQSAANITHTLWNGAVTVANGLGSFVDSL